MASGNSFSFEIWHNKHKIIFLLFMLIWFLFLFLFKEMYLYVQYIHSILDTYIHPDLV